MKVLPAIDREQLEAPRLPGPLGIGFPYIPGLPAELYQAGVLDFVEIVPETLCRERRDRGKSSIALVHAQIERAKTICGELPIVVHGVELSIGSAHGWNSDYLDMLDGFQKLWPFLWHSEHLGFQTFAEQDQKPLNTGVPLPLPATKEVVRLVGYRSAEIRRRYGVPFLLENPALSRWPAERTRGRG